MTCKFCGNEMDDHADFCFICGQAAEPTKEKSGEKAANDASPENQAAYELESENETVAIAGDAAIEEDPLSETTGENQEAPETAEQGKKKAKKEKTKANFFLRLLSFFFALIGLIIYSAFKKKGKMDKAYSVANAILAGLCVKMIAVILYKMFSYGWLSLDFLTPIIGMFAA